MYIHISPIIHVAMAKSLNADEVSGRGHDLPKKIVFVFINIHVWAGSAGIKWMRPILRYSAPKDPELLDQTPQSELPGGEGRPPTRELS